MLGDPLPDTLGRYPVPTGMNGRARHSASTWAFLRTSSATRHRETCCKRWAQASPQVGSVCLCIPGYMLSGKRLYVFCHSMLIKDQRYPARMRGSDCTLTFMWNAACEIAGIPIVRCGFLYRRIASRETSAGNARWGLASCK